MKEGRKAFIFGGRRTNTTAKPFQIGLIERSSASGSVSKLVFSKKRRISPSGKRSNIFATSQTAHAQEQKRED